jgi:hypothetical protein
MVNNVMFLMSRSGGRQIGYLNQKLVLNSSVKAGDEKDSPLEIGRSFNRMFELFPMSRSFLSDCVKNRNLLRTFGYEPNFFVDCKLGGLGVDPEFANGPVRLTSVQRRVAAAFTENVVNSFTFATGQTSSGPLARYLRCLPEVRLSTAGNAERWADRRKIVLDKNVEDSIPHADLDMFRIEESDASSYQAWVAVFTSMTATIEEREARRIDMRKVMKIRPMKRSKCLSLKPYWLFPELPRPNTGFAFSYHTEITRFGKMPTASRFAGRADDLCVVGDMDEIRALLAEL